MDLDRLRIFLGIVEHGTTSAAARAVGLTQPAVSRNLKHLEESLSVELFERKGRGLLLSAAGRALVPRARGLLAEASRLEREVRLIADERVYDVRIGAVDSIATHLLPDALVALDEAWPGLALKVHTGRTARLMEKLDAGQLDFAVVAFSSQPPGARVARLGPYGTRIWGRRDRFAELAEATSEADVQNLPIVEIEALPGQPTMIRNGARSFAVAGSLASVKAFVLAGFGVGALLDFMLTDRERSQLVCAAQLPHDADCSVYLVAANATQAASVGEIFVELERLLRGRLG